MGCLRHALKPVSHRAWERLTKAYAAGSKLSDAIEVCQEFGKESVAVDISYWPVDSDTPEFVADTYLAAIRALARERQDCAISVKAMVLGFDRTLIAKIVAAARDTGIRVNLDSRALELADQTLEVAAESARHHPRIGCALPGRWQRSLRDAEFLVDLGMSARVVKGQWPDPDRPDADPRAGFLAVVDRLAGRARHVLVATHDAPLAREALHRLIEAGTSCELELLFGLPMRAATQVARDLGVRTRVYVPYGNSWVPYALSWARKNPRVFWWILSDALLGRRSQFVK